jgi:hypothetical protein
MPSLLLALYGGIGRFNAIRVKSVRLLEGCEAVSTDLDHTFQFRVSGIELAEETKRRIASEIAIAATKAIAAEDPNGVTGELWSHHLVNGGRLLLERQALEATKVISESAPALLDLAPE